MDKQLRHRLQNLLTDLWLVEGYPTHQLINNLSAFWDGVDTSEDIYSDPLLETLKDGGYEWIISELHDLVPHLSVSLVSDEE
jgi:hypothetical protein